MNEERELEENGLGEIPEADLLQDPGRVLFKEPDPRSAEAVDMIAKQKMGKTAGESFENIQRNISSIELGADVRSTFDTRPVNGYDFLKSGVINLIV